MNKDNIDIVVDKRTAGEWEVVDRNVIRTKGNGFKFIAKVSTRRQLTGADAEAEANAAFICKAVNEYDNLKEQNTKLAAQNKCLLEALKKAEDIMTTYNLMNSLAGTYIKEAIKANETI